MPYSPPLPADVDQLLKPDTLAKWFQCSRAVVYGMARRGEIPSVLVAGKLVRFERRAVEEYIAARRRAG